MSVYDKKSINAKLQRLGQGAKSTGVTGAVVALLILVFVLFANFHAIYVKTGTPMMKYGLAFTFLQPFYSIWATWVVTSKYALRR